MDQKSANRGKILILLIIAAGVAAGTLKVWQQHRHMDQILAKLSPSVVRLIAEAPEVELLRLQLVAEPENSAATANFLEIEGRTYEIVDRKSLIGAKGLADVRDRLVNDASYAWNTVFESGPGTWNYVLQFTDGSEQARLAFDIREKTATIMLLPSGAPVSAHLIADGLATFFAAQFEKKSEPAK
jgi:hypothetical protein